MGRSHPPPTPIDPHATPFVPFTAGILYRKPTNQVVSSGEILVPVKYQSRFTMQLKSGFTT
jgi:hypothetical protein